MKRLIRSLSDFPRSFRMNCLRRPCSCRRSGLSLGRPHVDTLKGSDFANMKELRFAADQGVWRVAFAFDPDRQAILLVAGDKSGGGEKRFYRGLIARADTRYRRHLVRRGEEGRKRT